MVILLTGCDSPWRLAPSRGIAPSLRDAANHGAGTHVRLAELTDFGWQRFFWFGPYTSRTRAETALGFAWPEFDQFHLERSDAFSLLVFVSDGAVVHVESMPRGAGEFGSQANGQAFTPASANFVVERRAGVNVLVPAS